MKTDEYPEVTSSIIHVEKCLHEWFTIETMCFLFGDEKVKELISDKGECIKEYYKAVGKSSWDPIIQERYEALCRKLNIMEIKEQQLEKEDRQLKPLPDYSVLKEENLKMEIKIKAFYQGKLDYEIPESVNKEEKESFTPSCVLPLVDIHAQNALRRRMVFDNLKRVLPDLFCTFGMSSQDISSEVRGLVGSFRLSAHNITFSPPEWNLLGLIIIKMLSIKDMRLKMILEIPQGVKYQTMLLMTFQQDGGYLDRLMVWLTDMDNIMKKF
ncbi:RNA polymerase II subunit B1 CTD phosphatase Rpap2 [Gryllus bimaculatus]|nr:RNA polymerase II subunit B1 CTD phosphatase Rpap2 [Gryllus bimaculatus]